MRNIVITEKELETILKLINDWGFEYSLSCTPEEVKDLKNSLEACINLGEPEGAEV